MTNLKIYTAARIFTGEEWLTDHAVLVEGNTIHEVVLLSSLSSSTQVTHFDDGILVPSFIDLQLYGAYGKLLAVNPERDTLNKMKEYSERGGAAFCLPTVATNTGEVFYQCIDAVKDYWDKGGTGILGLHLEGPWINPEKRGAHQASLIHPPAESEVEDLLKYGKGVIRMITLAPEVCGSPILEMITSHNIVISAGHSNATWEEARSGFDHGVTAITHFYNAMSPLQHRQPGLAGAAMDDERVMASIIPDGYHVDFAAIRIAKKAMGERLFAITDAVTETTEGFYRHKPAGGKFEAEGILSGSALTMEKALQNLVIKTGIERGEALRMCSLYPARVLKMDHEWGRIEKGYQTRLLVLDENLNVKQIL